jgi:hypothetical protein
MEPDSRDVAWEWALAKGWAFEVVGSTVTVRDGSNYVMAEMDFCPTRQAPVRTVSALVDLEKSTLHVAVALAGLTSTAIRWWLKRESQRREQQLGATDELE